MIALHGSKLVKEQASWLSTYNQWPLAVSFFLSINLLPRALEHALLLILCLAGWLSVGGLCVVWRPQQKIVHLWGTKS
jgi:hypothetical protein